MKKRVYIYGSGKKYNNLCSYLKSYEECIEVMGIVTTQKPDHRYLDGKKRIQVDDMEMDSIDYVIIAAAQYKEIILKLKEKGFTEDKIIISNVFELPYFDLDEYIKLKDSQVSILSNNCLAGVVYKELGLKSRTPTINTWCRGEDYIKFLSNYEFYLEQEMKVYKGNLGAQFQEKGIINNDIIWHFNHSISAEDEVKKWNERVNRFNRNNIAVIMVIESDEQAYQFERLGFKKKMGIYYKDLGLPSIIYCQEWSNKENRLKYSFSFSQFAMAYMTNIYDNRVSKVDWIKFLNNKKRYLRY